MFELNSVPTAEEVLELLRTRDPHRLSELRTTADNLRRTTVGEPVHLRGLVELSNFCRRHCTYCGIRADRATLRYRMTEDEILEAALLARDLGYGTVVLQAGEDPGLTRDFIAGVVARIKSATELAVTLSLGEREPEDLARWRAAGADRYLLKFETSDPVLYARIHPPSDQGPVNRVELLRNLKLLGYEVGSGVMVGIPGQTWESLVQDLLLFRELDLDMIGVGPYVPHPDTPLGLETAEAAQVPADPETTLKAMALTRILCPWANIPTTTSLATIDLARGRRDGLQWGANVLMPNLTPRKYRRLYEIYPSKAGSDLTPEENHQLVERVLTELGRPQARGPGSSVARSPGSS